MFNDEINRVLHGINHSGDKDYKSGISKHPKVFVGKKILQNN
jgi:hypothetical protein